VVPTATGPQVPALPLAATALILAGLDIFEIKRKKTI
jgi:hypothetical protein